MLPDRKEENYTRDGDKKFPVCCNTLMLLKTDYMYIQASLYSHEWKPSFFRHHRMGNMYASVAKQGQWMHRAHCRSPFLDLSLDSKICSRFSVSKWPKPTQKLPWPGVLQSGLSITRKSGCLLAQKQTLPLTILCYLGTETRFQWGQQESFTLKTCWD